MYKYQETKSLFRGKSFEMANDDLSKFYDEVDYNGYTIASCDGFDRDVDIRSRFI